MLSAANTTSSVQPTYGKARAAQEAGERAGGLRGVIHLSGFHTWPEHLCCVSAATKFSRQRAAAEFS